MRRTACHRTLSLATVIALAACAVGSLPARAAMPLTEQGQPRAVIVHNGNTALPPEVGSSREAREKLIKPAVEVLQAYVKQITSAELPVVATLAEAAGKPAIVLEQVARVPGASEIGRAHV